MKNKFVFAGLVAVGAAGLQTAFAENLDLISPKCWNVSATLRGFYDDNYNISGTKKGSAGGELTPQISFNVPLRQTDFGLRYTYGLYYYQDRQDLGLNAFDQTHQADIWLDHAFNERWKANVRDTFAVGQEPELLGPTQAQPNGQLFRINGNNIANHGNVSLDTEWTRLFSTSFGYNNNFYDYENSGAVAADVLPGGNGASRAGTLNRIEQELSLDFRWQVQPETTAFIGYQFSWVNYTANEPIAAIPPPFLPAPNYFIYHSADRDNRSHYGYLGLEHKFTANLSGSVRGGASYTDSYNDPLFPSSSVSPYGDLSLSYTYLPGSYVQVGFTHDVNATDVAQVDTTGHLTQYSESSVLYADINHRFTQDLIGTIIGRWQNSSFVGNTINNAADTTYSLGINLHYQINRHFSVDGGYNYDNLVSDLPGRSYERNRVYLGLGANY